MDEDELARAVQTAVRALNEAMAAACRAGLMVSLRELSRQEFGAPPIPLLEARVLREVR